MAHIWSIIWDVTVTYLSKTIHGLTRLPKPSKPSQSPSLKLSHPHSNHSLQSRLIPIRTLPTALSHSVSTSPCFIHLSLFIVGTSISSHIHHFPLGKLTMDMDMTSLQTSGFLSDISLFWLFIVDAPKGHCNKILLQAFKS